MISIHALREEGDFVFHGADVVQPISIHALREEGDSPSATASRPSARYFYPRPPRGGRRVSRVRARELNYFYPRPPRGGRRNTAYQRSMSDIFLSTPSARRATKAYYQLYKEYRISIHALREEGDICASIYLYKYEKFLSTPSARRATRGNPTVSALFADFYPRPPRGGRPRASG